MIKKQELREILKHKILLMDGAMGTMIQKYNLEEEDFRGEKFKNHPSNQKGNNDLLCLTQPQIIKAIHKEYLEAGADIIETNTFNSTSISMADYEMQEKVYEINFAAAKIAKEAANELSTEVKPRFVAGAMGPTNKTASLPPDVERPGFRSISFDELYNAYFEQAKALLEGGVDILLIETVFDTLNAKAALLSINDLLKEKSVEDFPVMISGTNTDASGRTLSGQTTEAFLTSLSHIDLLSIGLNCSLGPKEMRPYIQELSKKSSFAVSVYPNAGLPNELGEYDQSPEIMADYIEDYVSNSMVNIVGGCCGTTPEHIREFSRRIERNSIRKVPELPNQSKLSGLENLNISKESNFINVGERTNVAGSRKFARLIREKKYEEALDIARAQVENGAQIIDICMDDAMLDAASEMKTFLNFISAEPDISRVPIMIDSSNWQAIEIALKNIQ